MLKRGWAGVVLAAGMAAGCQNKPKPVTEPPPSSQPVASSETFESVRASFKRANPGAEVGAVVAVLPESNLAAVGDVATGNFRAGDPITFLDGNLNDLTLGSVIAIVNGNLHVRYEAPPAGHRVPQVGDLAVRVPSGVVPPQSASGAAPEAPGATPPPGAASEPKPSPVLPAIPNEPPPPPAAVGTPPSAPSAPGGAPTPPAADTVPPPPPAPPAPAPELNK